VVHRKAGHTILSFSDFQWTASPLAKWLSSKGKVKHLESCSPCLAGGSVTTTQEDRSCVHCRARAALNHVLRRVAVRCGHLFSFFLSRTINQFDFASPVHSTSGMHYKVHAIKRPNPKSLFLGVWLCAYTGWLGKMGKRS
jgi:hypothetical protein